MKNILIIFSIAGLILTLLPSFLVFLGVVEFDWHKNLMLIGTLLWFGTAPFWMKKDVED